MPPYLRRFLDDIEARDRGRTRARRQKRGQHLDQRALAGAIGADQAENCAALDRQGHIIDGRKITELSRKTGNLNGYLGCWRSGVILRHWPQIFLLPKLHARPGRDFVQCNG